MGDDFVNETFNAKIRINNGNNVQILFENRSIIFCSVEKTTGILPPDKETYLGFAKYIGNDFVVQWNDKEFVMLGVKNKNEEL